MKINNRLIGPGQPTYIIAEISANHNQDFNEAVRLVEIAKEIGADAVKLQTYSADTMTLPSDKEHFQIKEGTLWAGKNLYELYEEAYTPWDWQPKLKKIADDLGIDLFSSAFDQTAIDFLEEMNVPAHKVASFEIVDIPLIEAMAKTGKPIIMSTGMATFEEIKEAVDAAKNAGAKDIALLKCTSAYPAPPEDMNLNTIRDLREKFQVPVGLSDHTLGSHIPVAAVALGACIIEKHLTQSREVQGPDSAFSLEPQEFKNLVDDVRDCEKSLGQVQYGASGEEVKSKDFRRSLFIVSDVKAGDELTPKNVRAIRPGMGLAPKHYKEILGKKFKTNINQGTPLEWSFIE